MKFMCPLVVVKDISVSRNFYETVLNQKVILDFGANITFEGDFALQSKETWIDFIDKTDEDIKEKSNNAELYFEEDSFDDFMEGLESYPDLKYVHGVKEYPWGQRVIRFYDPDMHIIEVGENMVSVVKRFLKQGLSVEKVAQITQYPTEFINKCLE